MASARPGSTPSAAAGAEPPSGDRCWPCPPTNSSGAENQQGGATPPLPPSQTQRPAATAASSGIRAAAVSDAAE